MEQQLNTLAGAGVEIIIFGPRNYSDKWTVNLERGQPGINLKISANADTLPQAVAEVFNRWQTITASAPELSLKQIDYVPPPTPADLDDEIPF